jgi:hypothetical protein
MCVPRPRPFLPRHRPPLLPPLAFLAALLVVGGAVTFSCTGYQERPEFLCCVSECTGGLVKAYKTAPHRVDAGWACQRGVPIDYNAPCTFEEDTNCNDDGQQGSSSGGAGLDGGPPDGSGQNR